MIVSFIELQVLKLDTQHQQATVFETHGKLLRDHFHFSSEKSLNDVWLDYFEST